MNSNPLLQWTRDRMEPSDSETRRTQSDASAGDDSSLSVSGKRPAPLGRVIVPCILGDEAHTDMTLASLAGGLRERHAKTLFVQSDRNDSRIDELLKIRFDQGWESITGTDCGLVQVLTENSEGLFALGLPKTSTLDRDQKEAMAAQFRDLHQNFDVAFVNADAPFDELSWLLEDLAVSVLLAVDCQTYSPQALHHLLEQKLFDPGRIDQLFLMCDNAEATDATDVETIRSECRAIASVFFETGVDFLGRVPRDHRKKRAALFRKPITRLYPGSPAARALETISDRLAMQLIDDYFEEAADPQTDSEIRTE